MGKLQKIETALFSINEVKFQELCDSFLALNNKNYSAFLRVGSQSEKQKSIKGTPDSLLLLPNGKYIFVEHSTNQTKGIQKLVDDILKCLDTSKTGIPVEQIEEIILCINFNLKTKEIEILRNLLQETRIRLTIHSLDSLALEFHLNHRDLAKEYLGISLDTGQIVSINTFINEYNKAAKGISTPIDNSFLHRESELKEVENSFRTNDFIIITGAPGVGKTKLALEAIQKHIENYKSTKAYCVSYKNYSLLEDLYQYLDLDEDYILFVDDANRIDALNQIVGFYKTVRKGKLKIVITVRDYAFQEIGRLCQEFQPKVIDLKKFNDEEINKIIASEPFKILNPDYQKVIINIADGNPRIAIMTSLLAKAEQDIYALSDVSELFEKYFSTFIKDDGQFTNQLNIKCLGLIAFFYTIPYKNKEITKGILSSFDLTYSDFIDSIDILDKLELVEIQFEHVKIPEQNLATYFFYKAFIKEDLLSFEVLLNEYFEENRHRFTDSVIPANNIFGHQKVMTKLKPFLKGYWKTIQSKRDKAFEYLSTFWYYLPKETLTFVLEIVSEFQDTTKEEYEVEYDKNSFAYDQNKVIELLGNFFRFHDNLKDSIELAFEYVRKLPEHLPELIHKIRGVLIYDKDDERFGFERQRILFEILISGLKKRDSLYATSFYEISKTFLRYKFHHTKGGRHNSFYMYDYPIPNNKYIHEIRKNIWEALNTSFDSYPQKAFGLLSTYATMSRDVIKEVMEYDFDFVFKVINTHLDTRSFEHCKYVHEQIKWFKRHDIIIQNFEDYLNRFNNDLYTTYLKIDWNRYRDKEEFEFNDYKEYDRLKENEIRSSFVFSELNEIKDFFSKYLYLKDTIKDNWNYNKVLDLILDENLTKDFAIGEECIKYLIKYDEAINFTPRITFINHLKTFENSKLIWEIIDENKFKSKLFWKLNYFEFIDDSLVSKEMVNSFLNTIKSIDKPNLIIYFHRLEKFLEVDRDLFIKIMKIIYEKNNSERLNIRIWRNLFEESIEQLGKDIKLIEDFYLQQFTIQNHFDYQAKGFKNILFRNSDFLMKYIKFISSGNKLDMPKENRNLSFVWELDDINNIMEDVFNYFAENKYYLSITSHYCNNFFNNISADNFKKGKFFLLNYAKKYNKSINKINIVVDIVRHKPMSEVFNEVLLQHVSINQDAEIFGRIWWRGNGGTYSGDVIIGDIEASQWRNILSIVEKSDVGLALLPIKKYLNEQIEYGLLSGDRERKRRFITKRF